MFGTVASAGIRIIAAQKINRKATLVMALSFSLGLSVEMVPDILCHFPETIKNIFSSGISSVCLGNASLETPEEMTFSKLLEYWEKRFWLSEFSHLGGNRNPTESNLVSVTEKARTNPFDENELKPMNKRLKDLLA